LTIDANSQENNDWIIRMSSGDQSAFAEFVEKYKSMVLLCCKTLGLSDEEAEDVGIEIFLATYEGLKSYKGQSKLSTWLWKIAYYKTISYIRKNHKEQMLLAEESLAANPKIFNPSIALENTDHIAFIWKTVKQLPKLWAMVIILFYREDKTIEEIAKIMQINQNTVKTYLFRGRQKLKEMLKSETGENINVIR
jgi:RNA polymerase sigma factor (sigma-70 family)